MDKQEALEKMLDVFHRYYTVNTETPAAPFAAEAVFHLHNENYFLIKSAKYAEQDSNEYVFFALADTLTPELFEELAARAWEEGLARAEENIKKNHRNSDVSLYILADRVDPACDQVIQKKRMSRSYMLGFRGYSHFRALAYDLSDRRSRFNYMGDTLMRTVRIVFEEKAQPIKKRKLFEPKQ